MDASDMKRKKCKCVYAIFEGREFLTREILQHLAFIHLACLQSDILHLHEKPSKIGEASFYAASIISFVENSPLWGQCNFI